jgi:lipoprotein-anchoring transpeptidase ErfK/SrfK
VPEDALTDEPGLEGTLPLNDEDDLESETGGPATELPPMTLLAKAGGTSPQAPLPDNHRHIEVNLAAQQVTAYVGGRRVRRMPTSTGRTGFATALGHYTIDYDHRDRHHRSSSYGRCVAGQHSRPARGPANGGTCRHGEHYEGAPMEYYQPFAPKTGFHQGTLPGHPDSHGCVHLSRSNAAWLWRWTTPDTTVDVIPRALPRRRRRP